MLVGFNPRNNTYITLVTGSFSFFYFLTHSFTPKITKMMKHQQMIKASDDASSIQNSNTVRHKGKASSGRKVIWYFPRSLLEFIYMICGVFFLILKIRMMISSVILKSSKFWEKEMEKGIAADSLLVYSECFSE